LIAIHDQARVRRITPFTRAMMVLIALGVFLSIVVYVGSRRPGAGRLGVQECQVAYRSSRTRQDSAIIDEQHPSTGPQKGPMSPSCGVLRKTGALK
jgi:hypothetical protein